MEYENENVSWWLDFLLLEALDLGAPQVLKKTQ